MRGERREHLIGVAARAASRMAALATIVRDRYVDIETVILPEEVQNEIDTYGHQYDEDCTSPFCTKVRNIYSSALQQAMTRGASNG